MAPKRPSQLGEPVAVSSSEEEEEASSEEEEEEEDPSEDEEEQAEKAPPKMASTFPSLMKSPSSKTQPAESSSDESSSDSEPEKTPAVKPIASKPMQNSAASAAAKKSRTKPPVVPAKRPGDGEASASAAKSSKRAKKNADAVEEPAKSPGGGASEKKLFQRLWSEDDEITILRGMIDYLKKGSDPNTDMAGFQEFIRKSITVQDFTKAQLQDKVRRLKKKYANNVKKKKYEPTNPLEKTAFELSKKIWANRPVPVPGPRPNGTPSSAAAARKNVKTTTPAAANAKLASPAVEPEVDVKAEDSGILAGVLGLERSPLPEAVVRRGLDLIPADKKAKLEADWRKIHLAEFELFAKKTQLMSDQSRLIFEALRSDS